MGRRQNEPGGAGARGSLCLYLVVVLLSCSLVYVGLSVAFRSPGEYSPVPAGDLGMALDGGWAEVAGGGEEEEGECCRGVEHLELWGPAVKWGTDHKFNSSHECCRSCKAMCHAADGPCLCDSWVFCGDRERCGEKFGECWLKKQKDPLFPALAESGEKVIWTSGLIFGEGEGIVALETEHGTLHIKLHPDCAPHSVAFIVELLRSRHCAGCQIYRAESRGQSWDFEGNHIEDATFGPPYAMIQGTLEAEGVPFKKIPVEACPRVRRGSVAWVGSGPEFFISLANHNEWRRVHTVFGSILPEDMDIIEKIARLPTRPDVWSNINVSVLEKPIRLTVRRMTNSNGALNLNENANSGSS